MSHELDSGPGEICRFKAHWCVAEVQLEEPESGQAAVCFHGKPDRPGMALNLLTPASRLKLIV